MKLLTWLKNIKKNSAKNKVYTYGVWDLFHYGHLKLLKQAEKLGDLTVGVFSDKVAEEFKRKPIMTAKERAKMLKELGYKVVIQNTFSPTKLKGIDIVAKAEGAGWSQEKMPRFKNKQSVLLKYTKGISTSDIMKRIWSRY
jgi:glycerol-3-phosphate cytidylyltransferase